MDEFRKIIIFAFRYSYRYYSLQENRWSIYNGSSSCFSLCIHVRSNIRCHAIFC